MWSGWQGINGDCPRHTYIHITATIAYHVRGSMDEWKEEKEEGAVDDYSRLIIPTFFAYISNKAEFISRPIWVGGNTLSGWLTLTHRLVRWCNNAWVFLSASSLLGAHRRRSSKYAITLKSGSNKFVKNTEFVLSKVEFAEFQNGCIS